MVGVRIGPAHDGRAGGVIPGMRLLAVNEGKFVGRAVSEVNLDGGDRAAAAGHPDKGDQKWAYQIGIGIGQLKAKHEWQLNVFWQHTDQYSLDPNLVDSDLFDSRVNMEGIGVQAGYMLSDAVWVNLTYGYGWRADTSLGTGGAGDIGINPLDHYQIFQADLNVKF